EQESNLLLESLEQAYKGNKQVVLLNGEPGLGKTRMVQLVYEEAMQKNCELIELRGSPYYKNSFFHPVVKILNHIMMLNEDLSNEDKLYQIEKAISLYGLSSNIAVPALSELLSIPLNDKYPADIETTPRQKKQLIMDILIEIILSMTRHRFVLFIVEDLQWIDHSTIEFLIQLINQTSLTNIYCLFTFRSDFPIPLEEKDNTELITLNHLTRKQSGDLIHQFCKFKSLPIDVFSEIVEKTDGIPLYIEEFTKAVLRNKTLIEKDNHYELLFPITQFEIPSTLHDLLMSKLDCLGNEKELAQICSILGREFSYELLYAVAERDEYSLHIGLNRLIKSEFILQHGQPPKSRYSFRHGLLCDTAYQSLLRKTRQKYHLLIATLIKNRYGYIISENPEIYAHHCTEAGKVGESLKYWLKAGQKAAQQSANREAIAHYSRGLSLLEKLPNTQENQIWELSFQSSLGLANSICKGYAATEVENAYNRAKELCDSINNIHTTFPVLCGLWEFYIVRARLDTAIELGNQLQDIANISKIPEFLLEARRILGTTFFWRGNLSESIQYFELSSNTPIDVRTPAPLSSHCQDSHVAAMANGSCALWLLGNPDQALLQANQALELSKHLAHPFSQAYALQFLATIHHLRGDRDEVARIADTQITLSEKYQFPFWAATGKMMFAWATSNNNLEISTREFEKAFSNYQQSGNKIARSYFSSLLAQLQNASGDIVAANKSIDQALKECATTNEKYFEAELLRIKGELELTNLNQSDSATAEEYFTKALNTARKQKAISLTLRILVNIFQLIEKNQSKMYHVKMIQDMLIENLQEISEGLDTTDVISAKITLSKIEEWIPPG
ncbi:MAG: AAA family ATPase, partial [Gammaproteobacteria bacterium]|nr:AAA family ATPase [Gammaproteobacteria bacterium]